MEIGAFHGRLPHLTEVGIEVRVLSFYVPSSLKREKVGEWKTQRWGRKERRAYSSANRFNDEIHC